MAANLALHISLLSIVVNLVLAAVTLASGSSSSYFAFAVDCILDVLSSSILVWRFYGDNRFKDYTQKELMACIGLGVMFIVSAIVVSTKAIIDLSLPNVSASTNGPILYLASASVVLCGLLCLGKYVIYRYTSSKSMLLESVNSLISSIFALVIVITTVIIEYETNLWRLDPAISIGFSVFMLIYGYVNCHHSFLAMNNNNDSNFKRDNMEISIRNSKNIIKSEYQVLP